MCSCFVQSKYLSKAVEALEVGVAVGGCGYTVEDDVFLCVCKAARGLVWVTWGGVFTGAYAIVVCSWSVTLQAGHKIV
jgi:hypothetical protein